MSLWLFSEVIMLNLPSALANPLHPPPHRTQPEIFSLASLEVSDQRANEFDAGSDSIASAMVMAAMAQ